MMKFTPFKSITDESSGNVDLIVTKQQIKKEKKN
jgi:hypothetical protein